MRRALTASILLLGGWMVGGPATAQDSRSGGLGIPPTLPGVPLRAPRLPPPQSKPVLAAYWVGIVSVKGSGPGAVGGGLRFDVIRSLRAETAAESFGLRVRVQETMPPYRQLEAILEATDVPALGEAVARLSGVAEAQKRGEDAQTPSTEYRFGLLSLGSLSQAERQSFFVSAGDKVRVRVVVTPEELTQVGVLVERAADKIRELEKEQRRRPKAPG